MPSVKYNTAANLSSRAWVAVAHLAFVPLYLRYLGIEAFGLIGLFTSLLALFALLDMGLSTTLNRELARSSADPGLAARARDLVRTLEALYWAVAFLIGAGVALAASAIATDWVRADGLDAVTVRNAVALMGLTIALQWPASLYSGGLMGLQRQVLLSSIVAVVATLRTAGAAVVLANYSATIEAFFWWQAAAGAVQTLATGAALWLSLPRAAGMPRFSGRTLAEVWRLAAGMAAITALAVALTQLDKLILVRLLPLPEYGYYSLAWTLAIGLYFVVGPLYSALLPRFTQLVAQRDESGLRRVYHEGCQWMSVVLLPLAAIMALFSYELMLLWTGDAVLAGRSHVLLSLLVTGTALNGLMSLPMALQIAHGWTRFGVVTNLIAVTALVPLIFTLTSRFGAAGGAFSWVFLNLAYVLLALPVMHRTLLRGEQYRWYAVDVGLPLIASVCVSTVSRWLYDYAGAERLPRLGVLACLAAIGLLALAAAAIAAPAVRSRAAAGLLARHARAA